MPGQVAGQRVQSPAWNVHVLCRHGSVQLGQLPPKLWRMGGVDASLGRGQEKSLKAFVDERSDHACSVAQRYTNLECLPCTDPASLLSGGLIGVVVATVASVVGSNLMGVPYAFDPSINLLALLFSAFIGVVFGYFPARRAARMDPIEALRHE